MACELFITAGHQLVANCIFQLLGAREGAYSVVLVAFFFSLAGFH